MGERQVMGELAEVLERTVARSVFISSRLGKVQPNDLRKAYNNRRWDDPVWSFLGSAEMETGDDQISDLVERLRPLLANHLQPGTGRVGNGLFLLMGGAGTLANPTVHEFAKILVGAAAKIGAQRVTELLLGWIEGEPLHYQFCALLQGVNVDEPLRLAEGVYLSKLSNSSADLPASLPITVMTPFTDYLSGVVLSVDYEMKPALYMSEENEVFPPMREATYTAASNRLPGLSFDSFCESMSLACNAYVHWQSIWRDYGDLLAFSGQYGGLQYKPQSERRKTTFSQEDLDRAREIHLRRHSAGSPSRSKRKVDLAIIRWMNSKRPNSTTDTLIELRIALEALYSKGGGEKRFRVAISGAWHLGETFEKRYNYYNILSKVYGDASEVIHAGEINQTDKELLANAQDICREGILKRIAATEDPAWDELILGRSLDNSDNLTQRPDLIS